MQCRQRRHTGEMVTTVTMARTCESLDALPLLVEHGCTHGDAELLVVLKQYALQVLCRAKVMVW